ncbi:MAG: hypothetical protein LW603_05510 [Sediminibacterium sp.]|nr:hypothetical protein [Sediminibacterium sp.]
MNAQSTAVSGVVYDISGRRPIEAVMVYSNTNFAFTDSLGRYVINVKKKDSVWFSLFGKTTQKYPIDTIEDLSNFNVMIHVTGFDLPEVRVRNSYYKLDSIQNRIDYAKYFNYQAPGIRLEGEELDRFMIFCKPSYEVLGLLNDLELGYYIQKKFEEFKKNP